MPIDFESCLLSSSPPGFDLNYVLNDHYSRRSETRRSRRSRYGQAVTWEEIRASITTDDIDDTEEEIEQAKMTRSSISCPKTLQRIDSWLDFYKNCCSPDIVCDCATSSINGPVKRKISFADEFGRQLEAVKIVEETCDSPPSLCTNITDRYSPKNSELHTLKLSVLFPQPASDYLAFWSTVDSKFVSLENIVVKNHSVIGTVRVKNVSAKKKVVIRYTLNNWVTFAEQEALYLTTGVLADRFSTFTFTIDCPPSLKVDDKLIFAVQFIDGDRKEFWDNNNQRNYEILCVTNESDVASSNSQKYVLNGASEGPHAEFPGWSSIDLGSPYW